MRHRSNNLVLQDRKSGLTGTSGIVVLKYVPLELLSLESIERYKALHVNSAISAAAALFQRTLRCPDSPGRLPRPFGELDDLLPSVSGTVAARGLEHSSQKGEYKAIPFHEPLLETTGERSFSKLKIVKNYLRTSHSQNRLNGLATLAIKLEISNKLNLKRDVRANSYNIFSSLSVQAISDRETIDLSIKTLLHVPNNNESCDLLVSQLFNF
nr:unnamed protein product [Callosobruchus analis]